MGNSIYIHIVFNVKVPQFGAPFIVPFDDPLRCDCNGMKFITWLILPVVICLSQRLSHACLSISSIQRNCEWLIITVIIFQPVSDSLDTHGNSRANTCLRTRLHGRVALIRYRTNPGPAWLLLIHSVLANRLNRVDEAIKFLTYQLPTVGYGPTVALTGNGELGFDSGEGA